MERLVTLVETSNSSGTFTGFIDTSLTSSASTLQLPDISGDDSSPIRVSFGDDTQPGGASRVVLETHRTGLPSITQSGVDSGSLEIGRSILLKVVDKDLDYNTGSRVTNVTVINTQGDKETVLLEQEGESSGIYTGSIATRAGAGASGDGVVNSLATGDYITMQYHDDDGSTRSVQARCGYAGVVRIGSVITGFSTSVSVTVIDPDLNQNTGAVEEYVTFSSEAVLNFKRGINNFPIVLTETASDSSAFTGVINFFQSSVPSSQLPDCEGVLNVSCSIPRLEPTAEPESAATVLRWDRAEISYSDPETVGGAAVKAETSNRVTEYLAPGQNGAVSAPLTVVAGSELSITVTDQDESANSAAIETVRVRVVSTSRTNEKEQVVVCRETGLRSRTFTGALRTREDESVNTDEAGVMHVSVEDTLEIIYRDNAAYQAVNHNQTWIASVVVTTLFTCRVGDQAGSICSGTADSVSCGLGFCATATPDLSVDNFVMGSCVGVTLVDSDKSTVSGSTETVTITAENIALGDREVITLTETGADAISFTGCIPSSRSLLGEVGVESDGVLSVRRGDIVSVYYVDTIPVVSISRTLTAIASQVGTISVSPASVQVGGNVSVTVSDSDLERDSARVDTAVARVSTLRDSEEIVLTETGVATAVFTGLLQTRGAGSVNQTGTLDGSLEGDDITAQYVDELPDNGAVREAKTVFGRVGLISMSGIRSQGWGAVTLIDQQPTVSTVVNVTLTSATTDGVFVDTIELPLLLQDESANTFVGRYAVTASASGGAIEYPSLTLTSAGNVISVLYQDLSPTVMVQDSREVLASDPGTLYTSPLQLPSGTLFSITIVDQDLNLDSSVIDYAEVRVTSSDAIQQPEAVQLAESSPASGTFTGLLETTQGSASQAENDGRIDANPGDVLRVEYFEQSPIGTLQSLIPVVQSSAGQLALHPTTVGMNGVLSITVQDDDENADSDVQEMISVTFSVHREGSAPTSPVPVHLEETATDSGAFTGSISAAFAVGSSIAVTYADAAPHATTLMTAVVVPSTVGVVEIGTASSEEMYDSAQGLKLRKAFAGEPIMVSVFDPDLNADDQVSEVASATVLATSTSQSVVVPLRETAPASGLFTGSCAARLRLSSDDSVGSDARAILDALDVSYGDQLSAIYHDAAPHSQRRSDHFVRIWMPGSILLLPSFALPGNTFSITVYDGDRDRNGTLREELMVSVTSSRVVGESVNVTLIETSPLSGAFTGSLGSQEWVSAGRSDSGILNLLPGDVLSAIYADNVPSGWEAMSSSTVRSTSCNCATLQVVPDHISAGEQVSIVVTDPDAANQGAEFLFVRVQNVDRPGQVQTQLQLLRGLGDTFSSNVTSVNTAIEKVSFLGPDNTINVVPGEGLQVTYLSVEATGTVEKTADVFVEVQGVLTLSPTTLLAGSRLSVTVDDMDLDRSPQRETTSVVVSSNRALEPDKRLTLTETGANTGRFTGELVTIDSADLGDIAFEGTMNVQDGESLRVAYQDELPRFQSIEQTAPIAEVGSILLHPVPLRQNGVVSITVTDIDANRGSAVIDTLSVNASAPRTLRTFMLHETGVNTGKFTATLSLSTASSVFDHETTLYP
eukprot:1967819-Rhodomonas_salina.1